MRQSLGECSDYLLSRCWELKSYGTYNLPSLKQILRLVHIIYFLFPVTSKLLYISEFSEHKKFTLKFRWSHFLINCHSLYLRNTMISFDSVDFWPQIFETQQPNWHYCILITHKSISSLQVYAQILKNELIWMIFPCCS